MNEIPESLFKALDQEHGRPLHLMDPRTREAYILIRADCVDARHDDLGGIDVSKLIDEAMQEDDANDPYLDSYQVQKGKQ